jgi:hypothetical protein
MLLRIGNRLSDYVPNVRGREGDGIPLRQLRKGAQSMNLNWIWAKKFAEDAKRIAHGIKVIYEWLGEGGSVVDSDIAQHRANVCLKCPHNIYGYPVSGAVANAIKRHLEVKNEIGLRVEGEKRLNTCEFCGCVLRLLIWEQQDRVISHLTDLEKTKSPDYCWKLEKP